MSAQLEVLQAAEADRLAALEAVVDGGVQTFVEVGHALGAIRDERLYRQTHATFEDYLRERWGISRGHGYRLIDAAKVVATIESAESKMSPRGDICGNGAAPPKRLPLPRNEKVARRLWQTAQKSPERATEIWGNTVQRFGESATPDQVAEVAAEVDAEPQAVPFDTLTLVKGLRGGASAALKAHKTRDPRDARRALAILRAAAKQLPGEYGLLDEIARADR